MIVYEKNNKLNINFDNEVNENPDLQISKEDGKTQILVDGQESGGVPVVEAGDAGKVLSVSSSGTPVWDDRGPLLVTFSGTTADGNAACDKTWEEISAAITAGRTLVIQYQYASAVRQLQYFIARAEVTGFATYIQNPINTNDGYFSVSCTIIDDNTVYIDMTET
jgi:hypothetical protein